TVIVEGEDLGGRQVGLGERARKARQPLARQGDETAVGGADRCRGDRCDRAGTRATATRGGDRLRLTGAATAASATTAATGAGALGLLVRDLGHREVLA